MDSIWCNGDVDVKFLPLSESIKCDVLIIGGGLAGLLCAHKLTSAGVDCVLVEARRICSGITKNTTAKITLQHGLIYNKLTHRFGYEGAELYLDAHRTAAAEYERLCKEIACDFEVRDSYVYSLDNRKIIENEITVLQSLGADVSFSSAEELPFEVAGAVRVKNQAQFHPLKFAYGIARGLRIYENTKVTEIGRGWAKTNTGRITCDNIIVATHFPILNKHGGYFLKLYQHRSYVIALDGAGTVDGMYVDEKDDGLSFRSYKNLLLLGGGAHRTGKKGGGWRTLLDFTHTHYHGAQIMSKWATQDCMSLDSVAYIGRYSRRTENLYVATGFNKWGVTSSMLSAEILTDLISGKKNNYAPLFSPSRSILHPQLAINTLEALKGWLTPTAPRCPHLGCALKYNPEERSWDCSCHGSRFAEDGELIDNPATDDKKNMLK